MTKKQISIKKNDEAIEQWKKYMADKVPMVVYATPRHFLVNGDFVVVPEEAVDFVINDFSSIAEAREWCALNGLSVREGFKVRNPVGMLVETGEGVKTATLTDKAGIAREFTGTAGTTLDGSVTALFNLTEKPNSFPKGYLVLDRSSDGEQHA